MMRFLVRSRKCFVSNVALFASFVNLLSPAICYTQTAEDPTLAALIGQGSDSDSDNEDSRSGYTVNFNNVPVIEVIRFVSKITNMNFVFAEEDIQFSVTIISEEPISIKNIMSALIQVLRIHDLTLLEQDNSLIITKSTDVNQIPTIVSGDIPNSEKTNAPLITRVFRIKNASVSSIANIIRPLTSKTALIEVSNETRQLIVTDITTNVDKIAALLSSLDAPHTPLEIDSYEVKNVTATDIIILTTQILSPFSEGNPLIFVPQFETNTIFVVSTPYLIERAMTVMEDIDVPPKTVVIGQKPASQQGVYVYKILNKNPEDMITSINEIAGQLQEANPAGSAHLIQALRSVKYISDTNSLMFVTDAETWTKTQELLAGIDTAGGPSGNTLYVYKVKNVPGAQMEASLKQMAETIADRDLVNTINNVRWIADSNSLVFSGTPTSIQKLETILPTLDVTTASESATRKEHFLIYTPKYLSGDALANELEETTDSLKNAGLSNASLIDALESMKWVSSTNSLVFTGDPTSLQKVQSIIDTLDVVGAVRGATETYIYKPEYASQEQLQDALNKFAENLDPSSPSDKSLTFTIKQAQWLPESDSFVFHGDAETINRLKQIIASLDNPKGLVGGLSKGFYLYKLHNASGGDIIENLKNLTSYLAESDSGNKSLEKAIGNIKWIKETNSLLITGSPTTIDQVKSLIAEFDVPAKQGAAITPKSEFFIYKPIHMTPDKLEDALSSLADDLQSSGLIDADLLHTMTSARIVPDSQSILFTGTPQSLEKLKTILPTVDVVAANESSVQTIGTTTFLIYKIKNADPQVMMSSMKNFAIELSKSNPQDKELADVINTVKYIKETNSILFTGPEDTLARVEKVAEKFDVVTPSAVPREAATSFVVYNPKYQSGDELISILCDFMQNLQTSGIADSGLYDTISHLKFIDKTNALIITGDADSIQKVEQLLIKFDIPGKQASQPSISSIDSANFLIYKLQYHKGNEIQSALKEVAVSLSKSGVTSNKNLIDAIDSLQWIQVTNSILGTGDPDVLNKLKDLIENLDVPLRQVFIEVLVIETDLYNSQNFGLQWGTQLQYLNKTVGAMGNFPIGAGNTSGLGNQATSATNSVASNIGGVTGSAPPVQGGTSTNGVPFQTGFDLGVIGDLIFHKGKSFLSLGGLVNALQIDNATTVVMNPKIITQDGHTSTIFVGQNIPFTGSFVSNTGQNSTLQTSNIEYRDVGVNLTITPTLGTNNIITLDISQDISEQVPNSTSVQGSTVTGIQTAHTSMSTRVHVPDNHFLVLSGMIQDSKNHFRTSLPCLGGLPVVGALFSESDRADTKTNVIIFLRPIIINSFEDYDKVTQDEEAMYKQSAVRQDLKEEFDDATETIKSLVDE